MISEFSIWVWQARILAIIFGLVFFSCTSTYNSSETFGFSQDYLIFHNEKEAETAIELFFISGFEQIVEQGYYDDSPVFLIQVPQINYFKSRELLDLEENNGSRFFPKYYHDKLVEFIIYIE
jgi:hypothetical protein